MIFPISILLKFTQNQWIFFATFWTCNAPLLAENICIILIWHKKSYYFAVFSFNFTMFLVFFVRHSLLPEETKPWRYSTSQCQEDRTSKDEKPTSLWIIGYHKRLLFLWVWLVIQGQEDRHLIYLQMQTAC